jgi:O-antigen/teichoic acid export membrane protein
MAALKSVSKASVIGAIQAVHGAILLLGLWLAYAFAWPVTGLLAWLAVAQSLELVIAVIVLARAGVYPRWPRPLPFYSILKVAAPFGAVYGLANLIIRSDTIILSRFVSLSELGTFSAANSLLLLVYVVSWLFGSVLLPEMMRLAHLPDDVRKWSNLWARRVALATVPVALVASLLAPRFIVVLFGPAYSASGVPTSLMLLACPLILLNSIYTTFTIATNNRTVLLSTYAATAFAAFVLDFLLARAFGALGVAAAIVVREAAMFTAFCLFTSRVLSSAPNLEFRPSSEGS